MRALRCRSRGSERKHFSDSEVIIWDFEQRKEIHRLSLHKVALGRSYRRYERFLGRRKLSSGLFVGVVFGRF